MKPERAFQFNSFSDLLRFYSDADEIVFKSHCGCDEQTIADLCREGRRWARRLRVHAGESAEAVASLYGIAVERADWGRSDGRLVYFAQCTRRPPRVILNPATIARVAAFARRCAPAGARPSLSEGKIAEVVTAHELFHLIAPPANWADDRPLTELMAHSFARAFTGLPFSPLLYETLLRRSASEARGRPLENPW
jgi:hypothetical protein